ncbi:MULTISPECIES: VCBS repeat-containing protein [unclassified Streptomyces]|uniref:FG-GAP repeat domain-containing protein n=1 Tax=unclassified Streptomyces TaxID=2593676 RepID=UPI0033A94991
MISGVEARKRRLRQAALAAAGLLLLAGCEDSRGRPPRPPAEPSAVTACLTASGALTADVNNDGRRDRVVDPSRLGARLTITFGVGTDGERTVGRRGLADRAGEHQQFVRAAVADFDGDGWTDLVVVAGARPTADSPITPKVSELRLGPFSDTGRGQRTVHLDLGAAQDIAVSDNNQDRYPDLLAYTYSGDGLYETRAHLGDGTARLRRDPDEYTPSADDSGNRPPNDFLHAGLDSFYPRCAPGDLAGASQDP